MEIEISITGLLLLVLTFFATIDVAFGQLSDVGLRRLMTEAEGRPILRTPFLTEVLENRPRFRFTLSVAIQSLVVAISVLVASIAFRLWPQQSFVLVALFAGIMLAALFRQVIPRLVSMRNPERTLLLLMPVFQPFYRLLSLVSMPWHKLFDRLHRHQRDQVADTTTAADEESGGGDDLQALIDVGAEEGILEEEEGELIHSIIEFGDTRANEVMTPRTDIVALPATATVREARDLIINSKYSRLPVYRDQIDNIEGIIYVRDLLQCWPEEKEDEAITPFLRPAYLVPETKSVADLLKEMQKAHVQLAVVIDEYGGVAGLVTVEDMLEEIVGEIEDEDEDKTSDEIIEVLEADGGYYEVPGSTEIGKIERLFDLEIEDDDFTTIAGLVISEEGRVPRAGTRLTLRGLELEVLEADDRRIGRLRLKRAPEESASASDAK